MKQCAYLFLNGNYANNEPLAEFARDKGLVIGVDGGTQFLLSINLKPHVIIGDMDSISPTQLQQLEMDGVMILRHPPEKDETDFELAMNYAILHGCTIVRVFGALGGRLDHMLGNIFLVVRYIEKASIILIHGSEELIYISNNASIKGKAGDLVSLIPVAGNITNVKTVGLRYPLNDEKLQFGTPRGISNEMLADQANVSISSGILLCVHTTQFIVQEKERSNCV